MDSVKSILWICSFTLLALAAKASIFEYMIFWLVWTLIDDLAQFRAELLARIPTDKDGV